MAASLTNDTSIEPVDLLQSINPDCVGWIHMDGCPLNYPVVQQRFDRDYYLTRNFSGEESARGQVALGFPHGRRMGDRTTVLTAHHMKDCSMFMSIVRLEETDYLAEHS
jgi:sortase B